MKIKTSIRAGSGGSTSKSSAGGNKHTGVDPVPEPIQPPQPPVYYSRCTGL